MKLLKYKLILPGHHAKKRRHFLTFLKAYLRYDKLAYGFVNNLQAIHLDTKTCPWIEPFIFALYQGHTIESALTPLRHYFDEQDYAYLIWNLKTNQLRDVAHHYIYTQEQTAKIKTNIIEQARYPLFLIGLSLILLILLQVFLLPQYQALTASLGLKASTLPNFSLFIGIGMLVFSFLAVIPQVKRRLFPIFLELEIISWAQTLELGLNAHLPLIECLIQLDNQQKLKYLKAFTQSWILQLRLGLTVYAACHLAPKILQHDLKHYHHDDDFFLKLKLKYQDKALNRLQHIERFIQPLLLSFVALICLYFFYNLYQPLFSMALL
ncbi:MAG: hypothetical protein EBY16_01985 [Gammaproteobacteria bacterium]|nr:hypothetical protein [Gammaproteobacteria bacterium]